ncbi:hypothetical protein FVEN_g2512 [Fusarium venenatum]|nr:hypothetical protein FVEN_g2512 [Fusarium venenatum]
MAPGSSTGAQSGTDSRKRKADTPAANGRGDNFAQRRQMVYAARSIPALPAETALKDGALDLQAFVAAHEFEIRALEQKSSPGLTPSHGEPQPQAGASSTEEARSQRDEGRQHPSSGSEAEKAQDNKSEDTGRDSAKVRYFSDEEAQG